MSQTPRIIAGTFKGQALHVPANGVRPTSAAVREAMFNMLSAHINLQNTTVADLYCGSGALGLEALSRGAKSAWFADQNPKPARENATRLGAQNAHFKTADAATPLPLPWGDIDIVFMDPPYDQNLAPATLKANMPGAKPGSLWMVETEKNGGGAKLAFCGPFELLGHKTYGTRTLTLLQLRHA